MIGRLLRWAGFDRSRTSRASESRPARSLGRRLAFESVERRVLLSANGNEPVAEGGTVTFASNGYTVSSVLCDETPAVLFYNRDLQFEDHVITRGITVDGGGVYDSAGGYLGMADVNQTEATDAGEVGQSFFFQLTPDTSAGKPFSSGQDADFLGGRLSGTGNDLLTAPKSEELVTRDIASSDLGGPLGDGGLADVGRIVRPEFDATIGELDWNKPPGTVPETQLADANASAAGASIQTVAYRPTNSLSGSRSRLATFDLAMRDDAPARHAHHEHATPSNHAVDAPTPAVETTSPGYHSAQAPTLSSLPGTARRSLSERQIAAHDLALANFAAPTNDSPERLETTFASRSARSNTLNALDRPDADHLADARAAYLNQRREKPVVHLVATVGIGSALATTPWDSAPQAQQEQLPPRKRQARHTSK